MRYHIQVINWKHCVVDAERGGVIVGAFTWYEDAVRKMQSLETEDCGQAVPFLYLHQQIAIDLIQSGKIVNLLDWKTRHVR